MNTITWTPVAGQFKYKYRLNGQYDSILFPNGQHRDYTYDDLGRLLQIANIHPTAGNLATYGYGYDVDNTTGLATMLGPRTSMTADVPAQGFSGALTKYSYDADYELIRADYPNVAPFGGETDSWTYDAVGNRLTNTVNSTTANYSYFLNGTNVGQRLQSDSVYSYTYDANGNTKTKIGPEGTYTFTWDVINRLTALSGPNVSASYVYDRNGRRIKKTLSGATTTYLYFGRNMVAERGAASADYLFGPGMDRPLAMSRSGSVYYFDIDGLRSVDMLNDTNGAVLDNYVTDAWGVLRSQSAGIANPFGYTGRESAETGLMYYRARYMNPSTGRFVSEDPLRFRAGINFYSYVGNNPVNFIDPRGLILNYVGNPNNFSQALSYLRQDPGMAQTIDDLNSSDKVYTIIENDSQDDRYDHDDNKHTIHWDPNTAACTSEHGDQSPALLLGHELAHADYPDWMYDVTSNQPRDDGYDTNEEYRVIQGPETNAARSLGEDVRTDHHGDPYWVPGPTQRNP